MDAVSIIIAALTVGAQDTANDTVASMCTQLRVAIIAKAAADPTAARTLERHAGNPDGYLAPLQDLLADSGAEQDKAILDLATGLLATADPTGTQAGKYTVRISGGQGTVLGDNNTVTQSFGGDFNVFLDRLSGQG